MEPFSGAICRRFWRALLRMVCARGNKVVLPANCAKRCHPLNSSHVILKNFRIASSLLKYQVGLFE